MNLKSQVKHLYDTAVLPNHIGLNPFAVSVAIDHYAPMIYIPRMTSYGCEGVNLLRCTNGTHNYNASKYNNGLLTQAKYDYTCL